MANIVFNIAKGRITEFYNRVKSNDPANSAFIIVPILAAGLVADATMIDYDDLATLLAGATDENTTMGRKTIDDTLLAALPAPDDTNDRYDISLPSTTWTAAGGGALAKLLVCYDSDTTAGTDSNIIPLALFDFAVTPNGTDITMTGGPFHRAA